VATIDIACAGGGGRRLFGDNGDAMILVEGGSSLRMEAVVARKSICQTSAAQWLQPRREGYVVVAGPG
jgi:hypothetical protein